MPRLRQLSIVNWEFVPCIQTPTLAVPSASKSLEGGTIIGGSTTGGSTTGGSTTGSPKELRREAYAALIVS